LLFPDWIPKTCQGKQNKIAVDISIPTRFYKESFQSVEPDCISGFGT